MSANYSKSTISNTATSENLTRGRTRQTSRHPNKPNGVAVQTFQDVAPKCPWYYRTMLLQHFQEGKINATRYFFQINEPLSRSYLCTQAFQAPSLQVSKEAQGNAPLELLQTIQFQRAIMIEGSCETSIYSLHRL